MVSFWWDVSVEGRLRAFFFSWDVGVELLALLRLVGVFGLNSIVGLFCTRGSVNFLELGDGVGFTTSGFWVILDDFGLAFEVDEAVARAYDGGAIFNTEQPS